MRTITNYPDAPSRRALLTGALAGGFLLAFHLPLHAADETEPTSDSAQAAVAPNAFIRIDRNGTIVFIMPQVEMGQGIYTALSMILAEELDADFAKVAIEHAPANEKLYTNPMLGVQATGNSNSVRAFWTPLRKAGASARAMLIQTAAQQWKVEPQSCSAANGEVLHDASGRKLAYGALAEAAAKIPAPQNPPLKDPKDFKLIGKPLKRIDTPDKVNGKAVYGIDTVLSGMKFATIAASPVFGGTVAHVDDSKARTLPGVQKVIVLDDIVAVVGDHMGAAKKGLDALIIEWNEGPNAHVSSNEIWDALRDASRNEGAVAKSVGDVGKGLTQGEQVEAAFELPFLAHATMEPMNCTVHLTKDSCDIWLGTQVIARVQSTAAQLTASQGRTSAQKGQSYQLEIGID